MTFYTLKDTPAGQLLLIGDGSTITGIHWTVFKRAPVVRPEWIEDVAAFREALMQLDEYFEGSRQTFDLPFSAQGTEFQQQVWDELAKIPFGSRSSYQAIARTIGNPKAVRAVGTAVGSNPLSIIVPCHRVLTSDNKLGGYAGGLASKELLLKVEGITWG